VISRTKIETRESSGFRNFAIIFGVVAALYLAREILIPLAFAVTLSMILAPFVGVLQKLRLGRVPSALLVVVIATASLAGVSWVIFNQLISVAIELPAYRENINKKLDAINAPGKSALWRAAASVKEVGKQIATPPAVAPPPDVAAATNDRKIRRVATPPPPAHPMAVQVVEQPGSELQYLESIVEPFLRPLTIFGMVLIFSLYLLIEQSDLRNRLFRLVGLNQLNVMTVALEDAAQRVGRYLMMQLLVNVVFGTVCGIGLYFIGLPYAALWGAVAAILRIVPYVGSLVAAALPIILSLAVFDGWRAPLLILALFVVVEVTTGNFVEPWLYGIHTGISSLALLLATVFWASLWGPAGLILSTPLTVCVVVLGRYVPQFGFLHTLLGDESTLDAEAQMYQRLLAMDDQEARAVADRYLKDHTLSQFYDFVLIPMLTLAERDRHKGSIDPAREEFLFLSLKEMLAELPDFSKPAPRNPEDVREAWPSGRIICIPANDEADEIAAAMLAQLLELDRRVALTFPVDTDFVQLASMVNPSAEDVICISAVPPFAFSHAKMLSRRLSETFPHTRIVVGVWGFSGDPDRALERFQAPHPDHLVTTLEQALIAVTIPGKIPAESI